MRELARGIGERAHALLSARPPRRVSAGTSEQPVVSDSEASDLPRTEFPVKEHPRNAAIRNKIDELFGLVVFRKMSEYSLASQATVVLRDSDVQATSALRRVLPSTLPEYLRVTMNDGHILPEGNPYDNIFAMNVSRVVIDVPRNATIAKPIRDAQIVIDAGKVAKSSDLDYLIAAGVTFDRHFLGASESLFDKGDITPEEILEELKTIVSRERAEFATFVVQRRQTDLHPMDRALIESIEETGLRIHNFSGHSGSYDDFLLEGTPNKQGHLTDMAIVFSAGSSRMQETEWRDSNVLDKLVLSWSERGRRVTGVTSFTSTQVSPEHTSYFTGKADLQIQRSDRRKPVHIPVGLNQFNREGAVPGRISELVLDHFFSYLDEGIGVKHEKLLPHLLATSIPLIPQAVQPEL